MQQRLAITGPKQAGVRPRPASGQRADIQFWLLAVVLVLISLGTMLEYVRLQTEQVKMGRQLERLALRRSEQGKALSNLDAQVQKYQSNTRYIEQAIRDFKLELRGNTQANVVKVDAYGSVLRQHPQATGNGIFAEASR